MIKSGLDRPGTVTRLIESGAIGGLVGEEAIFGQGRSRSRPPPLSSAFSASLGLEREGRHRCWAPKRGWELDWGILGQRVRAEGEPSGTVSAPSALVEARRERRSTFRCAGTGGYYAGTDGISCLRQVCHPDERFLRPLSTARRNENAGMYDRAGPSLGGGGGDQSGGRGRCHQTLRRPRPQTTDGYGCNTSRWIQTSTIGCAREPGVVAEEVVEQHEALDSEGGGKETKAHDHAASGSGGNSLLGQLSGYLETEEEGEEGKEKGKEKVKGDGGSRETQQSFLLNQTAMSAPNANHETETDSNPPDHHHNLSGNGRTTFDSSCSATCHSPASASSSSVSTNGSGAAANSDAAESATAGGGGGGKDPYGRGSAPSAAGIGAAVAEGRGGGERRHLDGPGLATTAAAAAAGGEGGEGGEGGARRDLDVVAARESAAPRNVEKAEATTTDGGGGGGGERGAAVLRSELPAGLDRSPSAEQPDAEPRRRSRGQASVSTTGLSLLRNSAVVDSKDDPEDEAIDQKVLVWDFVKLTVRFGGPALGIWLANPIMNLVGTAIVGRTCVLQLAALGPGSVLCDQVAYAFTFLSGLTSTLVATSAAKGELRKTERHVSDLLGVSLACGCLLMLFVARSSPGFIAGFVGDKGRGLIPLSLSYVSIRNLGWPALLTTSVCQSTNLAFQDSWNPVKVLAAASALNLLGDIAFCVWSDNGIAGVAWATVVSQYVAALLMLSAVRKLNRIRLRISWPSWRDFRVYFNIAWPIFLVTVGKTSFYALLGYSAMGIGTSAMAAHQVMKSIFVINSVCGEPLSQTAQTFMPLYIHSSDPKYRKRTPLLLKSVLAIGWVQGLVTGTVAALISWQFAHAFTRDPAVVSEMRRVCLPLFFALLFSAVNIFLEGVLLSLRDVHYLALSMFLSLFAGACWLKLGTFLGLGIGWAWWALVVFQVARITFVGARVWIRMRTIISDDAVPHDSSS
ncbi:hypothetical protein CBR_g3327 [Chara braunii]|uniref:Protein DETOXIFICATION n=1 Tax=Chara braunii TaxID=69332 RepID=A0A388KFJ8_CHABU|nr:hypothetical protein CBR_g3327 [Chara braunii]|eukprot:GBG68787.1 hypothetical protein CBR_g3327 [Chara braunii]